MKLGVFVERVNGQKYRASTSYPISLETEGQTRQQAIERLKFA